MVGAPGSAGATLAVEPGGLTVYVADDDVVVAEIEAARDATGRSGAYRA